MNKLLVVLGAALTCCGLRAAETVWTGAAGNGLWSDGENWSAGVPGTADTAVFDGTAAQANATVDEDFAGTVGNLTLAADYAGTITLEKDGFCVRDIFSQAGGTFVAGAHDLYLGCSPSVVQQYPNSCQFLLTGGTFRAPSSGHMLRLWGSQKLVFTNQGDWHHENGFVLLGCMGYYVSAEFNSDGKEYYDLEIAGDKQTTFSGNNTVLNHFIHGGGTILPASKQLDVYGDFTITNYPTSNGRIYAQGYGGLKINLVGDRSTRIIGGNRLTAKDVIYKAASGQCAGWWNPRTTSNITINKSNDAVVRAAGGPINFGEPSWYDNRGTFRLESGTMDFSGVADVSFDAAILQASDASKIIFPENTSSALGSFTIEGTGFAFHNLELDTNLKNKLGTANATNEVLGNLIVSRSSLHSDSGAVLDVHGDLISVWRSKLDNTGTGDVKAKIRLCGVGDQKLVMTNDSDAVRCPLPAFTIDKPSGRVWIDREVVGNAALTLDRGVLDLGEHIYCISNAVDSKVVQNGGSILTSWGGGFKFWTDSHPSDQGLQMVGNGGLKLIDPISDLIVHIGCTAWTRQIANIERMTFTSRCVVTNRFDFLAGQLYGNGGYLELQGDYSCIANEETDKCVDVRGGDCRIDFTGDRDQRVYFGPKTSNAVSRITVAKTGGRLILDSDWDLRKRRYSSVSVPAETLAQDVFLTSGTLDLNGHRLILPTGKLTVADGFTLALPPLGYADGAVASAGTVSLPSEGVANVRIDLMRGAAEAANPVRLCAYGTLEGFTDASCAVVPTDWVSRGKVTNDADASLLTVGWRRRGGFGVLVK